MTSSRRHQKCGGVLGGTSTGMPSGSEWEGSREAQRPQVCGTGHTGGPALTTVSNTEESSFQTTWFLRSWVPFDDLWLHHFTLNLELLAGELEIWLSDSQGSFCETKTGAWSNCPCSYPGPTLTNSEPQCIQLHLLSLLIHKPWAEKRQGSAEQRHGAGELWCRANG